MSAIALPVPTPAPRISVFRGALRGLLSVLASLSDYAEKKVLDHLTGKTAFTSPGPLYLALCTVVPTDADTGSTITEASYTGYARKQIPTADIAAASGVSAETHNAVQEQFAACTAGSSTLLGWALCDAATLGNVIFWGTCASTVISTTQTPATIAAAALSLTMD